MADFNTADPDRLPFFRPPVRNTSEPQPSAPTFSGGVTDHGALTGLGDDDHAQYHTDARGDARYSALGHDHDGDYEPALGNPAADGYVLQSTAAGVRSWAAAAAGGGDDMLWLAYGV